MANLSIGLSYKAVFTYLSHYWETHKEDDDLGGLLGSMNPFLWADGSPADKSLVKDFVYIIKGISLSKEDVNPIEGFEVMLSYLEKQLDWLKLEKTITDLKLVYSRQNSEEWSFWLHNWNQTTDAD